MINKKNVLGKTPKQLGVKDAVHVAIVAVRAAERIPVGGKITLNQYREAVNSAKGEGIADPFHKNKEYFMRGENLLMLMNQDEIPTVRHEWEHPKLDFSPPDRKVEFRDTLQHWADEYKVSYEQLMEAAESVNFKGNGVPYPGTLTEEELDEINDDFDCWEFWSEWADETGNYFENVGSECCPEYEYPRKSLFFYKGT